MATTQTKRPTKGNFVSQREITARNRAERERILRVLDQIKAAQQEVAATVKTPERR